MNVHSRLYLYMQTPTQIYPFFTQLHNYNLFPGGSDGKASAYNAGDPGLISRPGKSPGEGKPTPVFLPPPLPPYAKEGQFKAGEKGEINKVHLGILKSSNERALSLG